MVFLDILEIKLMQAEFNLLRICDFQQPRKAMLWQKNAIYLLIMGVLLALRAWTGVGYTRQMTLQLRVSHKIKTKSS